MGLTSMAMIMVMMISLMTLATFTGHKAALLARIADFGANTGGGLHILHILHNFTYILNNLYVWNNLHIFFAINIPIGGPSKFLFLQNVLDERFTNCSQRLRPIVDCKGNLPSRSAVANDAAAGK